MERREPARTYLWTSETRTVWSPEYQKSRIFAKEASWHDIYPYCLSLWPGTFLEEIFNGWRWVHRIKDICITVEMVVSGEIVYEFGDKTLTLQPGSVYLQIPGHNVMCRNGQRLKTHHFQITLFGGVASFFSIWFGINEPVLVHFESQSEANAVLGTMKKIGRLLELKKSGTQKEIYNQCHKLLSSITSVYHANPNPQLYPGMLSNAIFRMESNLESGITIGEIATDLGVSEMTLLRTFRKHLSMSPNQYLIKIRMEKASKLLLDPELPVKEVSSRLGYKNQLYFSAAFKKYYGISPSRYRIEQRKR